MPSFLMVETETERAKKEKGKKALDR